jgi:hypothetical protein
MSLPATIGPTLLDTLLAHLASLFVSAAADDIRARHAAAIPAPGAAQAGPPA